MARSNSDGFNPYHLWLGIPEAKCPPTFYELLGVSLNEDERAVIKSAADRQRSHIEQFLGTDFNKFANKLISQIDEAEITLLSPELRREYDRKVKLFKKRRKERQIDPNYSPSSISFDGSRSVGEGSGFLREYAGIVAILAVAFFCMAAASFWLPWGKADAEKVVAKNQPAQEKAPAPQPEMPVLENENPEPEMPAQEKSNPQPEQLDNSNLATIDVTIQSVDVPNQKITVSRESKTTILNFGDHSQIAIDGKNTSLDSLRPNQVASISFDPTNDLISKIEVKQSNLPAPTKNNPTTNSPDNANQATIDVTILAHDIPNQTLLVSRNSKQYSFKISPEVIYLYDGKPSSLNFLKAQKPEINATITFDAENDVVSKIETNSNTANTSSVSPIKIALSSVKKIWDQAPSNAFTDLCYFNNKFFCVFREGDNRLSSTSKVRILKSDDGDSWNPVAQIQLPQIDLRDPKITETPDGKLMLSAGGRKKLGNKNQYQTIAAFSDDGEHWSKPIPIGEPNMWLWRPTRNGNTLYTVGYHTKEPWQTKLYKSENGKRMEVLAPDFQKENMPVETALVFPTPTQALCVQRKGRGDKTATIGFSAAPFTNWEWKETGLEITSPELIALPNGKILLACKLKNVDTETVLFSINPDTKELTKLIKMPSAGDQGYPGLVFVNDHLWMSYHSSHEGKAAIYLAKLTIK